MASTKPSPHLSPAAIEAAWNEQWSRLSGQYGGLGRAHTQTLVVLAHEPSQALDKTLEAVSQSHPGRVVALYLDPPRRAAPDRATLAGRPEVGRGSELVSVTASGSVAAYWAELVLPLLLPEVPVYLFVADTDVLATPELTELLDTVDHVVLDTALMDAPWEPWRPLFRHAGELGLLDLAWVRTGGWREALASAFDPEPCLNLLADLASVEIQGSQPGTAHWLAGWLGNRLGYQPVPGSEGQRWSHRHRGPVTVQLVPRERGGLWQVTLRFPHASAEAVVRRRPGSVTAEVRQGRDLLCTAELPRVSRDTAPQLSAAVAEGFDPIFADTFAWLCQAHPEASV